MASSTTTIRLSDAEKKAWGEIAEFEGKSLTSFIKDAAWEAYEDFVDTRAAERGHRRYEKHPEEFVPARELWAEMFEK